MLSLTRLLLRFVWIALFVLGVKQAIEMVQSGTDLLIERLESGGDGPMETTLSQLHAALHRRQAYESGVVDPFGEM